MSAGRWAPAAARCTTWRCRPRCSAGSPAGSPRPAGQRARGSWWRSRSAPTCAARRSSTRPCTRCSRRTPSTGSTTGSGLDPLENVLVARFANSVLEPLLNRTHVASIQITMAEAFEVDGPRPVLRPHRRGPRRRAEPHAAGPGQRYRRSARRLRPGHLAGRQVAGGGRAAPADPGRRRPRPVRGLPRGRGVDPHSRVETYVAVRLELDTWRWAGVPILIRAGKTMPVTATEVSLRFHRPPHRRLRRRRRGRHQRAAVPDLARRRDRPHARRQGAGCGPAKPQLQELSFAEQPGSRHAAVRPPDRRGAGRPARPVRPPGRRRGRLASRRLECCPTTSPLHTYPRGSWGPKEADALLPDGDSWHDPKA